MYFLVIFAISTLLGSAPPPHSANPPYPSTVVGGQILIVEVGGAAFQTIPIGGRDWGISIVLGALSLPIAVLVRLLPPAPFERMMIRLRLFPDPNAPLPLMSTEAEERQWNEGKIS